MPTTVPTAASGDRTPKRAYLAPGVKEAVKALVWGAAGIEGEGRNPATLAEAAAAGGMKPDTLRRYLHRPDVRNLIADERSSFLQWATSANAQVLAAIRDNGANEAARVKAVVHLEEMAGLRERGGVAVNVTNQIAIAVRPGWVLDLSDDRDPPERTIEDRASEVDHLPTPRLEAELERRRPVADTVKLLMEREARGRADAERQRAAFEDASNPIFRPPHW